MFVIAFLLKDSQWYFLAISLNIKKQHRELAFGITSDLVSCCRGSSEVPLPTELFFFTDHRSRLVVVAPDKNIGFVPSNVPSP